MCDNVSIVIHGPNIRTQLKIPRFIRINRPRISLCVHRVPRFIRNVMGHVSSRVSGSAFYQNQSPVYVSMCPSIQSVRPSVSPSVRPYTPHLYPPTPRPHPGRAPDQNGGPRASWPASPPSAQPARPTRAGLSGLPNPSRPVTGGRVQTAPARILRHGGLLAHGSHLNTPYCYYCITHILRLGYTVQCR